MKHLVSKKYFSLLLLLLLLGGYADAQSIRVTSFKFLEKDIFPRTNPRLDLNEEPCAVIRIITNQKGLEFDGNIVGDPLEFAGETIVYIAKGSRSLTIRHADYGLVRYDFPERVKGKCSYEARVKFIGNPKSRRRAVLVVGSTLNVENEYAAASVMIGFVKKWGWYVKGVTNFEFSKDVDSRINIDNNGEMSDGTPAWLTSVAQIERNALTGGLLYQLSTWLYAYAGAGYGYRNVKYLSPHEAIVFQNEEKSYTGIEAEIGTLFRLGNFAISAGVQTNQFRFMDYSVGVGYIF